MPNNDELREQLEGHIRGAMNDFPTDHLVEWHVGIFLELIRQQTARAELEARHDELLHVYDTDGLYFYDNDEEASKVGIRIKELEQQLKDLDQSKEELK